MKATAAQTETVTVTPSLTFAEAPQRAALVPVEPVAAASHDSTTGHAVATVTDKLLQPSGRHARKGKIARLPKLHRDLVNRMLNNNIPHSKIVGALSECDIFVTRRNISNWRTRGGYKEWCLEQERQLQLAHMQDHLTDYLRKNDAQQLPEVGLQVAASQLSSMLLNPDAVRQLTAEPEKYSKVVEMLCRLSTHIQALQKDRNESVKKAAYRHNAEFLKREKEREVDITRHVYSCEYLGKSAREDNIPHRNELPPRDELLYQEPAPEPPSMLEIMQAFAKKKNPATPAHEPSADVSAGGTR
jgi:hypothetical protein